MDEHVRLHCIRQTCLTFVALHWAELHHYIATLLRYLTLIERPL
eukprot:s712_g1.t1